MNVFSSNSWLWIPLRLSKHAINVMCPLCIWRWYSLSVQVLLLFSLSRWIHQAHISHGRPLQWERMFRMQKRFLRRGTWLYLDIYELILVCSTQIKKLFQRKGSHNYVIFGHDWLPEVTKWPSCRNMWSIHVLFYCSTWSVKFCFNGLVQIRNQRITLMNFNVKILWSVVLCIRNWSLYFIATYLKTSNSHSNYHSSYIGDSWFQSIVYPFLSRW